MISLKNVNKYFYKGKQNEIHVIDNISMELPQKGIVAFFGKSGCGKTTLLNTIGGLSGSFEGSIEIDGQSINKRTDIIRNKYIGYVFQNYVLNVQENVFENVADALRLVGVTDNDELQRRVMSALKNVGMEKFYKRMPQTLSGGQQQRVAIARAIVKNPPIILADEPTGNLDENNTIMIMDLLKEISKEHLVLLVTHEAELVDSYCDKVIELKDGAIVDVKENKNANGLNAKNKNHIYLGEFEKQENITDYGTIEYYGDATKEPLEVKIVNYNGMLYLKINSDKAQIIDDASEVKILEGKFIKDSNQDDKKIFEIEPLGTIDENKIGKLFTLRDSLAAGLNNIKSSRKSKKGIRYIMTLFSFILVLLTSLFGIGIKEKNDIINSNNNNVFYAYIDDYDKANTLLMSAKDKVQGIDNVDLRYINGNPGDCEYNFIMPAFDSSLDKGYFRNSVTTFHGAELSIAAAQNYEVVAGTNEVKENEVVLTTAVADQIIKNCKYDFIDGYDSLLGFTCENNRNEDYSYYIDNEHIKKSIVGVVDSSENAIYYSKADIAKKRFLSEYGIVIQNANNADVDVEKGNVVLSIKVSTAMELPAIGDKVFINGNELTISDVILAGFSYEKWLKDNGISKDPIDKYNAVSTEFSKYEYIDYYYKEYQQYVDYCYNNKTEVVDYVMTQIYNGDHYYLYGKISELVQDENYYYAAMFKEKNGRYPTDDELFNEAYSNYEPYEVHTYYWDEEQFNEDVSYVLNEEDYYNCANSVGQSKGYGLEEIQMYDLFAVIHVNDESQADKYLRTIFDINTDIFFPGGLYTPQNMMKNELERVKESYSAVLVVWIVLVLILCLCVYLLMRGNTMEKIKTIGIYRCIGTTKRNVVFKFICETLVLLSASTLVGFLACSGIIWAISFSKYGFLVSNVLYYPVWLGVLLLLGITLVCVVLGIIPVLIVLRKSPSDILAQYDV